MSYPTARLCEVCEPLFECHWVSKDSVEPKDNDIDQCLSAGAGSESDSEVEPYETPDWVTTRPLSPHSYHSPTHHTIEGLEKSAAGGCYLCVMLWDLVQDKIQMLGEVTRANIGGLSSIVIARPVVDPSFGDETVQLELSFFDEPEKLRGFAFTVGLSLRLARSKFQSCGCGDVC
jgi:hypothetical protein